MNVYFSSKHFNIQFIAKLHFGFILTDCDLEKASEVANAIFLRLYPKSTVLLKPVDIIDSVVF